MNVCVWRTAICCLGLQICIISTEAIVHEPVDGRIKQLSPNDRFIPTIHQPHHITFFSEPAYACCRVLGQPCKVWEVPQSASAAYRKSEFCCSAHQTTHQQTYPTRALPLPPTTTTTRPRDHQPEQSLPNRTVPSLHHHTRLSAVCRTKTQITSHAKKKRNRNPTMTEASPPSPPAPAPEEEGHEQEPLTPGTPTEVPRTASLVKSEDSPSVDVIEDDEDLLDEYPADIEELDLIHLRILSIPALRLERFKKITVVIHSPSLCRVLANEEGGRNYVSAKTVSNASRGSMCYRTR